MITIITTTKRVITKCTSGHFPHRLKLSLVAYWNQANQSYCWAWQRPEDQSLSSSSWRSGDEWRLSSPAPVCSCRVWSSGECWQATHLFVRPVAVLQRPLVQQGGWEGPTVTEGGLCWSSEPGAAPPWRDLSGRASFPTKHTGRVVIAVSAWYFGLLEDARWPCTSDFSPHTRLWNHWYDST